MLPAAAGYLVIDDAGSVVRVLPDGVLSADGSTLWTARPSAARTTLAGLDPMMGTTRVEVDLAGDWRIPLLGETSIPVGLAPGGGMLLLATADDRGSAATSGFVVVDTTDPTTARPLTLNGWFEVDTLARDGSTAYLAELRPTPSNPHGYVVRALDLPAGTLREALVADKRTLQTGMAGEPYAQLALETGMVFTLYVGGTTFIHALDTATAGAVCIVFPDPATGTTATDWSTGETGEAGGDVTQDLWALAASPDDRSLFAVNPALGILHRISVADLAIAATTTFAPERVDVPSGSAVTGTGTVLVATADGILELDDHTGAVVGRRLAGLDIRTVTRLRDGRLAAIDSVGTVHLVAG